MRGRLRPVAHRGRWIAGGLGFQLAGVGVPFLHVVAEAKHEDVGGLVTLATVRLAWHESMHTAAGIAVLTAGVALFAVGSVLLARPFAQRKVTLLVSVPLAAVCGALVLGVAALIVALLVLVVENGADLGFLGGWGSGGKRKPQPVGADTPDLPVIPDATGN